MKIGFSLGRCVRDIVGGQVAYDDVYLIVSRTLIHDSSYLDEVVEEYSYRDDYLGGLNRGECLDVMMRLYLDGKIYQPRLHGKRVRRVAEDAVWMDLAPTIMDDSQDTEQVKKTWDQYQLALKMTSLQKFPKVDLKDDF